MRQNKINWSFILSTLSLLIMALILTIILWKFHDSQTIVKIIDQKYIPAKTLTVTNVEPYDSHLSTNLGRRGLFDAKNINPNNIYGDIKINYTFSDGTNYDTTFNLNNYHNHEMPDINSTVQKTDHYIVTYKLKNGETKTIISKTKLKIKDHAKNYEPEIQWTSIEPYRKPLTMGVFIQWSRSNGKVTVHESTTKEMTFHNDNSPQ